MVDLPGDAEPQRTANTITRRLLHRFPPPRARILQPGRRGQGSRTAKCSSFLPDLRAGHVVNLQPMKANNPPVPGPRPAQICPSKSHSLL
jgi:hypothetical protein